MTCIEIDFYIFVLVRLSLQFEFFFYFDSPMNKTLLKALFSTFCLLEIIVRPGISLMTTCEVYNVF